MKDLIEALTILSKYQPTHCEYDTLYVVGVRSDKMSEQDRKRLVELGFSKGDDDSWYSYRFGSA